MALNIYLSKSLTEVFSCFLLFEVSKLKWPNRIPALVRSDSHRREPGQISSMPAPSNQGNRLLIHPPAIASGLRVCISFRLSQLQHRCCTKRWSYGTSTQWPSSSLALVVLVGSLTLHVKQLPLQPGMPLSQSRLLIFLVIITIPTLIL